MANKTNSSEYLEYLMRSYRLSHVIFTAFEIGLFKSIIKLGIIGKERIYYWKLFFWSLFRRPVLFPMAITCAIYGFHFRRIFEQSS